MQNNKLKNIPMRSSALSSERHNLSRDIHTTFNFGEFQPTFIREMEADTSASRTAETAALLAPMVGPTMGRLNLESYGMFVPTLDIFPCYKEYMTGTRFTYGSNTFVPLYRPKVLKAFLSLFCLIGAKLSLYDRDSRSAGIEGWKIYSSTHELSLLNNLSRYYQIANMNPVQSPSYLGTTTRFRCLNSFILLYPLVYGTSSPSLASKYSFLIPLASDPSSGSSSTFGKDSGDQVNIGAADYVIQVPYAESGTHLDTPATKVAAFAFKLSDFGKRLRKVLIGCGIHPDFDTNQSRDITPLLAVFKAYYDMFGIMRWSNWQDTPACKLINWWLAAGCPDDVLTAQGNIVTYFHEFMVSLGRLWYTEQPDYISAHTANVEEDTSVNSTIPFIDVGANLGDAGLAPNVVQTLGSVLATDVGNNHHAAIVRLLHSQIDSNILKKMYLWTNRDSVIGLRIEELLRAQGHGKWVDEHKSHFIGKQSVPLVLKPEVSSADTYEPTSDNGALLGEYGGRGIGYRDESTMSYKTKEHGWFIVLSCVVPKSGYAQGDSMYLERATKNDEYQPEFDGLGMEATRKSAIVGYTDWNIDHTTDHEEHLDKTFGFIPQMSRFKVIPNLANADIDLGSRRDYFLHYTLDKMMYPNLRRFRDRSVIDADTDLVTVYYNAFDGASLPIAGEVWRYPTRYAWLTNFMRIFALRGDDPTPEGIQYLGSGSADFLEFTLVSPDSFIVHQIQDNRYWSGMRLISESYETLQDGNNGSADMQGSKA